jgi:phage gpG-like protein
MNRHSMKIEVWFDRFDKRFNDVAPIVAETSVEYFKERFIQKNWEGVPWAPFKNKKREPSKGSLMMRTNNLFSSIRPSVVTAEKVIISAGSGKVPYARVHNEGLRVRGVQYVRPYTHPNMFGKGRRQVKWHARKVDFKMPKRQFMGNSATLNGLIMDRIKKHFSG